MEFKLIVLLCILFNVASLEKANQKVKKSKGRLSRVTWQLENDKLNHDGFPDSNSDALDTKVRYKSRKYNVKMEHKRKDMQPQVMSNRKEIGNPKYVHDNKYHQAKILEARNKIERLMNKKKLKNIMSSGVADVKRAYKSVPKIKDRKFNLNNIEMNNERKKTKQKQIQQKPKPLYLLYSKRNDSKFINPDRPFLSKTESAARKLERGPFMAINSDSLSHPRKKFSWSVPKVHEDDDTSIADKLSKKVRVLCWVLTHPENHASKCTAIKDTWGKRCNKILFMSTEYDPDIPTVKLDVQEGRSYLWPKVKAAFKYVYENYHDQYDWFVRADDDTYIVMENLRYLLANFDPQKPMYFGCRFKHFAPQGYMSGGGSIPLSRAALEKLVPALENDTDICIDIDWDLENDDVNLGICLGRVGVKAMDSRDVARKGRFLVFMPQDHLSPTRLKDKSFWYWKYMYYPTESGVGCCSDYAISFHYVSPDDMYSIDFLIYRLRPYGIQYGKAAPPGVLENNPTHDTKAYKPFDKNIQRKEDNITITHPFGKNIQRKEDNITITQFDEEDSGDNNFDLAEDAKEMAVTVTTVGQNKRTAETMPEISDNYIYIPDIQVTERPDRGNNTTGVQIVTEQNTEAQPNNTEVTIGLTNMKDML